jgi:hypothetical protein
MERFEERLSAGHVADRVDEIGASNLLEDIADGPRGDCLSQDLVIGERGEHQAGDAGVPRTDLTAHVDAAAVGQPDIEDRDVGKGRGDDVECLCRGSGLAHDHEVVLQFEKFAHPAANAVMVIEKKDPDRHRFTLRRRSGSFRRALPLGCGT